MTDIAPYAIPLRWYDFMPLWTEDERAARRAGRAARVAEVCEDIDEDDEWLIRGLGQLAALGFGDIVNGGTDDLVELREHTAPHVARALEAYRAGALDVNLRAMLAMALVELRSNGQLDQTHVPPGTERSIVESLREDKKSVYEFRRPDLAWAALAAGAFDEVGHWLSIGKLTRSVKPNQTFPWDERKLLKYIASACRLGAPLDAVLPAWNTLLAEAPRMLYLGTLKLVHVECVAAAVSVHLGGGSPAGATAFLRDALAPLRARPAGAPRRPEPQSAAREVQLPDAACADWNAVRAVWRPAAVEMTHSGLWRTMHNARYGIISDRRTCYRLATFAVVGMVCDPPLFATHLELAAAQLPVVLKAFKRLDQDRCRSAPDMFSLLRVVRAFGVRRPPDTAFPADGPWIDAVFAYQGPMSEHAIRTAVLAAVATRGAAGFDDAGAGHWWEHLGHHARLAGDDPGLAAARAMIDRLRSSDRGARDACVEAIRAVPRSELRFVDAVWLAHIGAVLIDGREEDRAGDWLRAAIA